MKLRKINEEVLVAESSLVCLTKKQMMNLKNQALANLNDKIRICTHQDINDPLHEMLIVHKCGTYVRPHKHINKTEAIHIIEGNGTAVFFDEDGVVNNIVRLGDYLSGLPFYYRLNTSYFHTLVIESDFLVFHEVINGPFRKEDTIFAPWAPDGIDEIAVNKFQAFMARELSRLK